MTSADLKALAEGVKRHEAQLAGVQPAQHNALGAADQDFHLRIAQSSGNPLLIQLLCFQFYPLLRLYRSRRNSTELRKRALLKHQRILAAIEDRDGELAELLMRRHISNARKRRAEAMDMGEIL